MTEKHYTPQYIESNPESQQSDIICIIGAAENGTQESLFSDGKPATTSLVSNDTRLSNHCSRELSEKQLRKHAELAHHDRHRREFHQLRQAGVSGRKLLRRQSLGHALLSGILPGPRPSWRSTRAAQLHGILVGAYRVERALCIEASAPELAALLDCHPRTVQRAAAELEAAGHLVVVHRDAAVPDCHASGRQRAQLRSLYCLPYRQLCTLAAQQGRTLPMLALLLDLPADLWRSCGETVDSDGSAPPLSRVDTESTLSVPEAEREEAPDQSAGGNSAEGPPLAAAVAVKERPDERAASPERSEGAIALVRAARALPAALALALLLAARPLHAAAGELLTASSWWPDAVIAFAAFVGGYVVARVAHVQRSPRWFCSGCGRYHGAWSCRRRNGGEA